MSALWWKRFQAKHHITYDEHRLLTFGVDGYPVEDLLDDQELIRLARAAHSLFEL